MKKEICVLQSLLSHARNNQMNNDDKIQLYYSNIMIIMDNLALYNREPLKAIKWVLYNTQEIHV